MGMVREVLRSWDQMRVDGNLTAIRPFKGNWLVMVRVMIILAGDRYT